MKDYIIISSANREITPSLLMEELDKLNAQDIDKLTIRINYKVEGYGVSAFEPSHQVVLSKWLVVRKHPLRILNLDGNALTDRNLVGIINSIVNNPDLNLNTLSVRGHNIKLETLQYILDLESVNEITFKIEGLHCQYDDAREMNNVLNSVEAEDIITKIHVFNQLRQPNFSDRMVKSVTKLSFGLEKMLNHKVPSYLAKGLYCLK